MSKKSVLFLAMMVVLSGCHAVKTDMVISGRVMLKSGEPSIGAQGDLCLTSYTAGGASSRNCEHLFTDTHGDYLIPLNNTLRRLVWNSVEVTDLEIGLQVGKNYYRIRRAKIKDLDLNRDVVENFTNTVGYSWGRGEDVKKIIEQAEVAASSTTRDSILSDYANEYTVDMNPAEVIILANATASSTTRDSILGTYARRLTKRGKLNRFDIGRLADEAASSTTRDSIIGMLIYLNP